MPRVCYLNEVDYKKHSNEFIGEANIFSPEDIATLMETVSGIPEEFPICNVKSIVESKSHQYVCVISDSPTYFDFFEYLNTKINGKTKLGCANVKLLYPRNLSRGIYNLSEVEDVEISTDELDNEDEEAPTGYMDPEELKELENAGSNNTAERFLFIPETGAKIPVDEVGIVIGRSSRQSDYAVRNPKMSRQHAKVYKTGNKYKVSDLGSANGTFIDGLRVKEGHDREITPGAKLVLADSEFKFV